MRNPSERNVAKGGRPAKFAEPSRPVTMTLPDRILARLSGIDDDRAKAVVKAVEAALGGAAGSAGSIAELPVASDESLLTVPRCRALAAIPWVRLVEISPGRNLISLRDDISVEQLEVALEDALDAKDGAGEAERRILRTLLEKVRTPRRNRSVRTEQILVVRTAAGGSQKKH